MAAVAGDLHFALRIMTIGAAVFTIRLGRAATGRVGALVLRRGMGLLGGCLRGHFTPRLVGRSVVIGGMLPPGETDGWTLMGGPRTFAARPEISCRMMRFSTCRKR